MDTDVEAMGTMRTGACSSTSVKSPVCASKVINLITCCHRVAIFAAGWFLEPVYVLSDNLSKCNGNQGVRVAQHQGQVLRRATVFSNDVPREAIKKRAKLVNLEKVLLLGSDDADAQLLRRTLAYNVFLWWRLTPSKRSSKSRDFT